MFTGNESWLWVNSGNIKSDFVLKQEHTPKVLIFSGEGV